MPGFTPVALAPRLLVPRPPVEREFTVGRAAAAGLAPGPGAAGHRAGRTRAAQALVASLWLGLGCGGSGGDTPIAPYVITIQANAFEPQRLLVPAGATVVVVNRDPWLHSVTSEAAPGALVQGTVAGVGFDTGPFDSSQAFTLPASAPPGTVIPYFCTQLGAAMRDEGEVVVAPAP